jgi:hypothetical protein
MTTTLNTSRSENTMVLSARVSACMYFLVIVGIIHQITNNFQKIDKAPNGLYRDRVYQKNFLKRLSISQIRSC